MKPYPPWLLKELERLTKTYLNGEIMKKIECHNCMSSVDFGSNEISRWVVCGEIQSRKKISEYFYCPECARKLGIKLTPAVSIEYAESILKEGERCLE